MSTKSKRLDLLLEELGLFPSRQVARTAIMEGAVLVNGQKIDKPGAPIKDGAKIELTSSWQAQKYVSRGGFKLEKAIAEFQVDVNSRVCLDVGASTGGFTDCLLQSGAGLVYAVDVGYGQIAWSLRTNPKVKVIERVNARNLNPALLKSSTTDYEAPSLAVIDVSFISLIKVLPAVKACMKDEHSEILALVKPQFEAGRENVGKGGVVRSPEIHKQVIKKLVQDAESIGLTAQKLTFSPLKGPQGNIEFLILLSLSSEGKIDFDLVDEVVENSASSLN